MTAEAYLQIYKKIWATIRHDIWKEIEDTKKSTRKDKLSSDEMKRINDEQHDKFEGIRVEIYAKILDDSEITSVQARRNMQRCYAINATVSSLSKADGSKA